MHIRTDGWLGSTESCDEPIQLIQSCSILAQLSFHDFKQSCDTLDNLTQLTYVETLYNAIVKCLDECCNFKHSPGNPIMALNSIRFIKDIIHPIIHHSRSGDRTLVMTKGPSIDDKRSCYLLSRSVYSTVTKKQFGTLKKRYRFLVEFCIKQPLANVSEPEPLIKVSSQNILEELLTCFNLEIMNSPRHVFERTFQSILDSNLDTNGRLFKKSQILDRISIYPLGMSQDTASLDSAIQRLQEELYNSLSPFYSDCQLTIYGSCLSNLSLEAISDVDISISIPRLKQLKVSLNEAKISEKIYFRRFQDCMFTIRSLFTRNPKIVDIVVVTRARIPLIKGRVLHVGNPLTTDGSMSFDLCFLNDIAVANSSLLREYSLIDERVRYLMLAVKLWAKRNNIASAMEKTISSYAWMNLVIFFLQCIEFTPNLQSPSLMCLHDFNPDQNHLIDEMNTAFLTSTLIKQRQLWTMPSKFESTPVSLLLYGFFSFYASFFPHYLMTVSIKEGRIALTKFSFKSSNLWRLSIEDPFETHDSSNPHDLGIPLSTKGQKRIAAAFQYSAERLREFLLDDDTEINLFDITKVLQQQNVDNDGTSPPAKSEMKILSTPQLDNNIVAIKAETISKQGNRNSRKNRLARKKKKEMTEAAITDDVNGPKSLQPEFLMDDITGIHNLDSTNILSRQNGNNIERLSPEKVDNFDSNNLLPKENANRQGTGKPRRTRMNRKKKMAEAATTADENGPKETLVGDQTSFDHFKHGTVVSQQRTDNIETSLPAESDIVVSFAEPYRFGEAVQSENGHRLGNRKPRRKGWTRKKKKEMTVATGTDTNVPP